MNPSGRGILKRSSANDAAAQVFILAVFLVSLASGAAVCAKFSEQLQRPLLWVAAIQVLVALNAVYFYDIFIAAQRAAFSVLPALESGFSVNVFKFVFAAFLIAPQTILLGATFPLMCAGLTRLRPESSGQVLSLLYFILALSGAAGILVGGFLLVPQFGLPGTGTAPPPGCFPPPPVPQFGFCAAAKNMAMRPLSPPPPPHPRAWTSAICKKLSLPPRFLPDLHC